ncbi:hypothetical protein [Mucilaginibacter lacusdianchii]|uniref:hypothetical protein n=1 Tax=Mucilaginibacter lacusdianchii TaxID=2684211 RepID=UPI00131DE4F5|nr:hypothetical protein [Mucilaginibacter sp. JXJ CY 39]
MKKILLAAIASFAMFTGAFAQGPGSKLSVGPEVGLPLGDAGDGYSVTLGGTLKLEVPVSNSNFNVTFTSGYINYFGKNVQLDYATYNGIYSVRGKLDNQGFIPVKIGGKYYANKNVYFEGEVGIVTNVNSSSSSTAFAYAPSIGVSLPVADTKNAFDLGFRYEGWTKDGNVVSQIALRLAYKFKL